MNSLKFPGNLFLRSDLQVLLDPTRLALRLKKPVSRNAVISLLEGTLLVLEDHEDDYGRRLSRPWEKINHTPWLFWTRSRDPLKAITGLDLSASGGHPLFAKHFDSIIDTVGPVYRYPKTDGRSGLVSPSPNTLLIPPAPQVSAYSKEALVNQLTYHGLKEVVEMSRYLGGYRQFTVEQTGPKSVYEIQAALMEGRALLEGQVAIRVPDIRFSNTPMLSGDAMIPLDPTYKNPGQWNMWQIEAGEKPGAKPKVSGWDISTGNNKVAVWVVDTLPAKHPDLNLFRSGGTIFDEGVVVNRSPEVSINSLGPIPVGDHATRVAGLIAAVITPPGRSAVEPLGIAGLAGDCQVIPLMVGEGSDIDMVHAFNFAAQHWNQLPGGVTARVLSCSKARAWYTNPTTRRVEPSGWPNFANIDNAISNAVNAGIVICAPTDNSNVASIAYPASNPNVIACGASDQEDQRCRFSNYGDGLSVVAPGTNIPTTDAVGLLPSDIYISDWEGTSAAAPQVAGLAALLLSKYPTLTSTQVRKIIELSADKTGGYPYNTNDPNGAPYPNGKWSTQMGYGRINVLRALNLAKTPPPP